MHARSSETSVPNMSERKVSMSGRRDRDRFRGFERPIPKLARTGADVHEGVADRSRIGALHSDADIATAPPLVPVEAALRPKPRSLLAGE